MRKILSAGMRKNAVLPLSCMIFLCLSPHAAAEESRTTLSASPEKEWSFPAWGGYVHQFDVDLDDGGRFRVDRFFIQGGPSYSPAPRQSIALAVGYGYDGYDFSGAGDFATAISWDDIHSFRASLPVRWGVDSRWTIFAVPSIRFTGESGADWNDAATAGGFAGFSYRFNDRLSIGPGIGVFSQLEESAGIFPIFLISWKITDDLSLNTGSGMAATQGPGLSLDWKFSDQWEFHAGGRYEKHRFRLDDEGMVPDGIGEDASFPLVLGATYYFNRDTTLTIVGGLSLAGELRLENDSGTLVVKDHYDPAGFTGITFRFRL